MGENVNKSSLILYTIINTNDDNLIQYNQLRILPIDLL